MMIWSEHGICVFFLFISIFPQLLISQMDPFLERHLWYLGIYVFNKKKYVWIQKHTQKNGKTYTQEMETFFFWGGFSIENSNWKTYNPFFCRCNFSWDFGWLPLYRMFNLLWKYKTLIIQNNKSQQTYTHIKTHTNKLISLGKHTHGDTVLFFN